MTQQERQNLLKEIEEEIAEKNAEFEALSYAAYLVEKKHAEASSMIAHVPNNIYIEAWKSEEKATAQKLATLERMIKNNQDERATLCHQWNETEEQLNQ